MREKILALTLAAILLVLCGCEQETKQSAVVEQSAQPTSSPQASSPEATQVSGEASSQVEAAAPVQWDGLGGYYVAETLDVPENVLSVYAMGDSVCYSTISAGDGIEYTIQNDDGQLYKTSNELLAVAATDDALWIVEDDYVSGEYYLKSVTGGGVSAVQLSASYFSSSFLKSMVAYEQELYLLFYDKLVVLDEAGQERSAIDASASYCVVGNELYLVESSDEGNTVYSMSDSSFSTAPGRLYSGDGYMILSAQDGIYKIDGEGNAAPIVIFAECSLTMNIDKLLCISGGRYFCLVDEGAYLLSPAEYTGAATKTKLTMAAIGQDSTIAAFVTSFNNSNDQYTIDLVDYTNGGELTDEQAAIRLNAELVSGSCPDLLTNLPFDNYRSFLADMRQYFSANFSLDDIVIASQLGADSGIYYIGGGFTIETMCGKYSSFGDVYGWTIGQYLAMESAGSDMLYNVTKEDFLIKLASRYISSKKGLNFESAGFIEILEAAARISENPEDLNDEDYAFGESLVGSGSLVAASVYVDSVWKLAYARLLADCQLSFIGWPTSDGSSGSDIHLRSPVAIVAASENGQGCFEFIKFMLTNENQSNSYGLPVYKPLFEKRIQSAKEDETLPVTFTDADAAELYALINATNNLDAYDETILAIIKEESAPLLQGQKIAAEVAKLIQNRVSTYLAEQG